MMVIACSTMYLICVLFVMVRGMARLQHTPSVISITQFKIATSVIYDENNSIPGVNISALVINWVGSNGMPVPMFSDVHPTRLLGLGVYSLCLSVLASMLLCFDWNYMSACCHSNLLTWIQTQLFSWDQCLWYQQAYWSQYTNPRRISNMRSQLKNLSLSIYIYIYICLGTCFWDSVCDDHRWMCDWGTTNGMTCLTRGSWGKTHKEATLYHTWYVQQPIQITVVRWQHYHC